MSQEQIVICKFNQFGFCKFKQHCNKKHDNEICGKQSECEDGKCSQRHPKICRNFTKDRKCRHRDNCAYLHIENVNQQTKLNEHMTLLMLKHERDISALIEEVNSLKSLVQSMSIQLDVTKEKEVISEDFADKDNDKVQEGPEKVSSSEPEYKCDLCNFKSEKLITLNKHKNTKHDHNQIKNIETKSELKKLGEKSKDHALKAKFYCDMCDFSSTNKKTLKKHIEKGNHIKNGCDNATTNLNNVNHIHDSITNTTDYECEKCTESLICESCLQYPEVDEAELDGWIAKAAENETQKN